MADRLHLVTETIATPTGDMMLVVDGAGRLRAADWTDKEARLLRLLTRYAGPAGFTRTPTSERTDAGACLGAYFDGDLVAIDRLQIETGGTAFQRLVWRALRDIPAGRTMSYRELATRIGRPTAIRAVGAANGANPVSIVVPCHRLIGTDGALTGYGGGLERKAWLLRHEGEHHECRRGPSARLDRPRGKRLRCGRAGPGGGIVGDAGP